MTHACLNELWIEHPGIVASVIYFFRFAQECKMCRMLKTPPHISFFNVLKKKYRLSLPVVFFINSVPNRCINNTLSAFNWQHFLPTESLRLNHFLFATLKKNLAGMYNINEKNSNIKVTERTFPENLNGKL